MEVPLDFPETLVDILMQTAVVVAGEAHLVMFGDVLVVLEEKVLPDVLRDAGQRRALDTPGEVDVRLVARAVDGHPAWAGALGGSDVVAVLGDVDVPDREGE